MDFADLCYFFDFVYFYQFLRCYRFCTFVRFFHDFMILCIFMIFHDCVDGIFRWNSVPVPKNGWYFSNMIVVVKSKCTFVFWNTTWHEFHEYLKYWTFVELFVLCKLLFFWWLIYTMNIALGQVETLLVQKYSRFYENHSLKLSRQFLRIRLSKISLSNRKKTDLPVCIPKYIQTKMSERLGLVTDFFIFSKWLKICIFKYKLACKSSQNATCQFLFGKTSISPPRDLVHLVVAL